MKEKSKIYIYPTDTVWGIGSSIGDANGNREVAIIKKTSFDKPLTVLFTDLCQVSNYLKIDKLLCEIDLTELFSQEVTVGLPTAYINNKSIPDFILCNSEYIYFRCLPFLAGHITTPITTTSLNLTGENAINKESEAISFYHKVKNENPLLDFIFISDVSVTMSGNSSTIVCLKNKRFEIIRSGVFADDISKKLNILPA